MLARADEIAVARSRAAAAQSAGSPYRIGLLYSYTGFNPDSDPLDKALVRALEEQGYLVGRSLVIEVRSAYGHLTLGLMAVFYVAIGRKIARWLRH